MPVGPPAEDMRVPDHPLALLNDTAAPPSSRAWPKRPSVPRSLQRARTCTELSVIEVGASEHRS